MKRTDLRPAVLAAACVLLGGSAYTSHAEVSPVRFTADPLGEQLQQHLVWIPPGTTPRSSCVAFRKVFTTEPGAGTAKLSIFADVRYLLWIDGKYILRGPSRFNPKGPEYDQLDITSFIVPGPNTIAVLVMGDLSNGKMMHHQPGLTLRVDLTSAAGQRQVVETDPTWKWSDRTQYRSPKVSWGNVADVIDSTMEDGDWTLPGYDDSAWNPAALIDGRQWGPLIARRIPLLREKPVPLSLDSGLSLPARVGPGNQLHFHCGPLAQAYVSLEFEATVGTRFEIEPNGITYTAKAGHQVYLSSDTHAVSDGTIKVISGSMTIERLSLVELTYPFDCAGEFESSDPFLDKLWKVCTHSLQVMSEDAYVDCADRERVEWMDNDPPDFDVTRTAMTGPGDDGHPLFADPRLLKEMLRRTALTLQPEGWVKAHTCSDRFDIHAKMEDRACDWIEGARRYYESTNDASIVREIWPAVTSQLDYFLARRSSRGLVIGREWVIWGNPMGYQTCEGTVLNAYVCKSLGDAAYLAGVIGEPSDAGRYEKAGQDLTRAINTVLWDEHDGTYYSGYYTDASELPPGTKNRPLKLAITNDLVAPTIYPALFALDQGVVPPEQKASVTSYLLTETHKNARVMFYYYYFKQLYALNEAAMDQQVLDLIHEGWQGMADSPWQTTWENLTGGSHAHCYGMFPAYYLSAYVLGVRREEPASAKRLVIDPRPGGLGFARGTVITEFGPVAISWQNSTHAFSFRFELPARVSGELRLRARPGANHLTLDGAPISCRASAPELAVNIGPGLHSGALVY